MYLLLTIALLGQHRLADNSGRVWTHRDQTYLRSWVASRNVTLRYVDPSGKVVKEEKTTVDAPLTAPTGYTVTGPPRKRCFCDRNECHCPVGDCKCELVTHPKVKNVLIKGEPFRLR